MQALQAYEGQVSALAREMSRLEEDLRKAQEEKASLLSDLASVRELCVKLDSGKELIARQLTSKSMDLERVKPAAALLNKISSSLGYESVQVPLSVDVTAPAAVMLLCFLLIYTHVVQVTGELEDVQSEAELLKKQLASERLAIRNLETLLSSNRQKEFQTHLTASEKDSELKILRDRLTLADSKTYDTSYRNWWR